jgi:hypothetical protein
MTPARTLILAEIGRMALIKKHMPIRAEPYDGLSVGSMQNLKPVPQLQPVGMNCDDFLRTTCNAKGPFRQVLATDPQESPDK